MFFASVSCNDAEDKPCKCKDDDDLRKLAFKRDELPFMDDDADIK